MSPSRMRPARIGRAGVGAASVALLVGLPWILDAFAISLASRVLALGLLAMGVNLLTGVAGQPTLGQAAYLGAGAYAAALVGRSVTPVGVVQVVAAMAVAALFALLTGFVVVRARGVTFLMLTFAVGELTYRAAVELDAVSGGTDGRSVPPVVPVWGMPELTLDGLVYLWALAVFLPLFGATVAVVRSPFGLALRGLRDNEPRLLATGYPTRRYLLTAYTLAGALAGAGGALLVSMTRFVAPVNHGFEVSALALIAVVIGGRGSMWGAVAGTAVVVFAHDYLGTLFDGALAGRGALFLGAVFVLAVYLIPGGLAGVRLRRRPG